MRKFRGYSFDERTVKMIKYAEKQLGAQLTITQGSYNTGGVAASAGTHDGGGVVDFSVAGYNPAELKIVLRTLKDAGFAAWSRTYKPGVWPAHIHAVAIGCTDLSPSAKRQVVAFDKHKDGLVTNLPDYSYHPQPKVYFSFTLNKPVKRGNKIVNAIKSLRKKAI